MISLRLVCLAALAGGSICGIAGCDRRSPGTGSRGPVPPQPAWFQDVGLERGLKFVHETGATGAYFMPESLGSGGALFDYDNDGRLDLYLIHCVPPGSPARNQLFHQEPDGRLRNASEGSGLDVTGYGMGAAAADVNNDGFTDLLLTEYGRVRLFLNLGNGTFADATTNAGIDNPRWATAAAFFDYDRDGWLDLVVANYVDYTPGQRCVDARGAPEYCGPQGMAGTVTRLFHNLGAARSGSVRFEDVTVRSGLARWPGPALGVFCADVNGDRWPDIFIADDGQANRLFINQQNGTFSEEAARHGLAYNGLGATAANMGIAPGDVDGDGLFDLFVTHLNWEQHALWRQIGRGTFQEASAAAGLSTPAWRGTGFGTILADFDLDGSLDLVLVNGSIKRRQERLPVLAGLTAFWAPYAERNQVFANSGQGKFVDRSESNPDLCALGNVGRGLLCGDLDNDGRLDLVTQCAGGPARLFHNVAPPRGHWLMLRLVEPAQGGRDAYGAEVIVEAAGSRWWRLVQPGYGYLSSQDPRIHVGLGPVTRVDRVRVLWPEGVEELFPGPAVDRIHLLRRGEGSPP